MPKKKKRRKMETNVLEWEERLFHLFLTCLGIQPAKPVLFFLGIPVQEGLRKDWLPSSLGAAPGAGSMARPGKSNLPGVEM